MSEIRPEGSGRYRNIEAPANSHKSKERPEKDIKQVATGVARKKTLGTRIKESFTGDDAQTVGGYILFDVVLPAAQQLVVDAFQQGIERLLLGDSRPNRARRQSDRRSGYTSYNRYSDSGPRGYRSEGERHSARATHDFDQIILGTRGEAEEVLDCLGDLLEQYEQVTVSDLYRLVGIRGNYMDDRWGWTHLRGARTARVRDGYVLELPAPVDLDRRS